MSSWSGLTEVAQKLGVLGGTFDPVHIAHLILGETAREQLGLGKVLFVPAGQPWRKAGRTIAAAEHRLAMLRLAIEGNPAFEVSMLEVERPGPSYTAETLTELEGEEGGVELFLVVGEDSLADLPNWREPERILQLATIAVAAREGEARAAGTAERGLPGLPERVVWLKMPLIEISATAIRERVRQGLSIRYLVPDAVERYIQENGLYRE